MILQKLTPIIGKLQQLQDIAHDQYIIEQIKADAQQKADNYLFDLDHYIRKIRFSSDVLLGGRIGIFNKPAWRQRKEKKRLHRFLLIKALSEIPYDEN